ncbi:MAG TPA: ABC transporter permease, partial [Acidimicrobiales bacterium]|nr:ABC transporter permease [Acidimicrobiales bacterium]
GNPRQSPVVPKFDTYSATGLTNWLADLEGQQRVVLSDVAGILRGLLTQVAPLTMIAILLVPISYIVLWRTRFGLRLRSCGENPVAAESLGVNVYRFKYIAVLISGGLAGMGGASLVLLKDGADYLENQTNGRGYIGLAAMIFGNWRPGGLAVGAGLFGFTDALSLQEAETTRTLLLVVALGAILLVARALVTGRWRTAAATVAAGLLAVGWFSAIDQLPTEVVVFLPHLTTLLVLTFASQRLRPPAADGRPYRRGDTG